MKVYNPPKLVHCFLFFRLSLIILALGIGNKCPRLTAMHHNKAYLLVEKCFFFFKKTEEFNACTLYGNSVCTNGQCIPVDRSFRCLCNPGYVLSGDGTACLGRLQRISPSHQQLPYSFNMDAVTLRQSVGLIITA